MLTITVLTNLILLGVFYLLLFINAKLAKWLDENNFSWGWLLVIAAVQLFIIFKINSGIG